MNEMEQKQIFLVGTSDLTMNIDFLLHRSKGLDVKSFNDVSKIIPQLSKTYFQIVIIELSTEGPERSDKVKYIKKIRDEFTNTIIIVCSSEKDVSIAFEVGKIGVYRFIRKEDHLQIVKEINAALKFKLDCTSIIDDTGATEKEKLETWKKLKDFYWHAGIDTSEAVRQIKILEENIGLKNNIYKGVCLDSISTHKLSFFDDFTWKLKPHINILLGENGFGKTLLLRLIASLCQGEEELYDELLKNQAFESCFTINLLRDNRRELVRLEKSISLFKSDDVGIVPMLAISGH